MKLLKGYIKIGFLALAYSMAVATPGFSSVNLSGANLSPINPVNASDDKGRGRGGITEEKKKKIIEETIEGTVMRSGVVYPIHAPIPAIDLARQFLREGRPAVSGNELRELVNGLTAGDPKALENFRAHMQSYLMDPSKGPQLIGALNRAIDNPNAYKADPNFAKGVLREAFDKFLTLNGDARPNTDFSRVDLSGFMIAGTDLRATGLKANNLNQFSDRTGTNASGLDLKGVAWENKTVIDSIFSKSVLDNANFANKNLAGTSFADAYLKNANFSGAQNMGSSNFSGARAGGANFSGVSAPGANFNGADLSKANLSGANLQGADLRGANLSNMVTSALTNLMNALLGNNLLNCPTS